MNKNYRLLSPDELIAETDEIFFGGNEKGVIAGSALAGFITGRLKVRREIVPPTPTEPSLDIVELALCESTFILPRPNQLYKYYVGDGCEKCEAIANVYKQLGL